MWTMKLDSAYWEVRRAIVIVAFFGGLRVSECRQLSLEKICRGPDGFTVTHVRVKQRSDKLSTKFLVPQAGGFADMLAVYLDKVRDQLQKFEGNCWYTGRKNHCLVPQPMGKNMVAKVPHEVASLLKLDDPAEYTFHSFRRTSATEAADYGSTSEQMKDFFGWSNSKVCGEYISSSRPAIMSMAKRLSDHSSADNSEMANDLEGVLEQMEGNDMEVEAGIPVPVVDPCQLGVVQNTVGDALAAVQNTGNREINLKVVVINNMSGNLTL